MNTNSSEAIYLAKLLSPLQGSSSLLVLLVPDVELEGTCAFAIVTDRDNESKLSPITTNKNNNARILCCLCLKPYRMPTQLRDFLQSFVMCVLWAINYSTFSIIWLQKNKAASPQTAIRSISRVAKMSQICLAFHRTRTDNSSLSGLVSEIRDCQSIKFTRNKSNYMKRTWIRIPCLYMELGLLTLSKLEKTEAYILWINNKQTVTTKQQALATKLKARRRPFCHPFFL